MIRDNEHMEFYRPLHGIEDLRARFNKLNDPPAERKLIDLDEISIPVSPTNTPFAWDYLATTRHLTPEEIYKYNIRVGKRYDNGEYMCSTWKGRVLFPYTEQGQVRYVIGRAYEGQTKNKYVNTKNSKYNVLYGIEEVKGTAIVCEGLLTSWAASKHSGVPAVAILGKSILDGQVDKLRKVADTVYICMDGGVERSIIRKLNDALKLRGFRRYEINLPDGKDADELGPDFKQYFDQSIKLP
jgi:DNA primase